MLPAGQALKLLSSEVVNHLFGVDVQVDWAACKLVCSEAGDELFSVQIFLSRDNRFASSYVVEFIRSAMDFFAFKAFYTQVHQRLASIVRSENVFS